jgi:hypothetical protein
MRIAKTLSLLLVLLSITGCAGVGNYWYSPLTAVPVGPAGPPSMLSVSPVSPGPSEALKVTAASPVSENDFQWVLLGLAVPPVTVKGIKTCYQVQTSSPGSTYISQVRLTHMTTPDSALVIHDDPANLAATSPTCSTSPSNVKVEGTITLRMKMVFGSSNDVVRIGGVELLTE